MGYLANKCSIASRIDCFSESHTKVYGEKLKEQVEDRLKFYETGDLPRKNVDVMEEAMEIVKEEAKSKKKEKKAKKKRKIEDENGDTTIGDTTVGDTTLETSVLTESEEPPKKKKKKNKNKDIDTTADVTADTSVLDTT